MTKVWLVWRDDTDGQGNPMGLKLEGVFTIKAAADNHAAWLHYRESGYNFWTESWDVG